MRNSQVKKMRREATNVCHSYNAVTYQNIFQFRIPKHIALFFDLNNLPSNVIQYKNDLIFTQRRLDPSSVKAKVKKWKKYMNRLSHFEKQKVWYSGVVQV